ncbi:hypothetical protein HOA91_00925 [Candidatus Woesearchaeota archaeon]|jgi:hypothetical protein|nr:hypothetical protein [Candidatus Woesearchaeota archaeon]
MISKKRGVTLVVLFLFLIVLSLSVISLEINENKYYVAYVSDNDGEVGTCEDHNQGDIQWVTFGNVPHCDKYGNFLEGGSCGVIGKHWANENECGSIKIRTGIILEAEEWIDWNDGNKHISFSQKDDGLDSECMMTAHNFKNTESAKICADDNYWYGCDGEPFEEGGTLDTITWAKKSIYKCAIENEVPIWQKLPGLDLDHDTHPDLEDCEDDPNNPNLESPANCPETPGECSYPPNSRCAICINPGAPEVCGDDIDNDCNPDTSNDCHLNAEACRGEINLAGDVIAEEKAAATIAAGGTPEENPKKDVPETPTNIYGQSFSWIETAAGGYCCGYEGIDDLGLVEAGVGTNENSNYVCLSKNPELTGYSADSAKVFGDHCGTDWCWLNANEVSTKFNVFTIKKTGDPVYDLVSNSRNWQTCNSTNLGPIKNDPLVEDRDIANRFYCYQEGEHYSWAECFGEKEPNNENVKGRHAGDGLYNLYLRDAVPNEKGEAIVSGSEIIIKSDEGAYQDFYQTLTDNSVYFDFSGYDQLEFFVRFTDNGGNVLTFDTLTLPLGLDLILFGPDEELYFQKNVIGNVANNIQFGEDNWLHIKVPIPDNLKAVSHLKITPSPTKNQLMIKNVQLTNQGTQPLICSGKDDISRSSWLDSFDDGNVNTNVNAEDMCTSHYGQNAWLGDANVVEDPSASCCGNGDASGNSEYYSDESKPIGETKYGCWNNQPIANEQTIMDVEFKVDYTEEKITINYPGQPLILNLLAHYYVCPDDDFSGMSALCDIDVMIHCLGDHTIFNQETCIGLPKNKEYSEIRCPKNGAYEYCKEDDWDDCISNGEIKECDYVSSNLKMIYNTNNQNEKISTLNSPKLISSLTYTEEDHERLNKFVLEKNSDEMIPDVFFFHPSLGKSTELSIEHLKQYGTVDIYAETDVVTVNTPTPNPDSQTFIYPCNATECLYPLPGIPSEGITVTNLHPELYELYFVTFNEATQKTDEQLITPGNDKIEVTANLLAKKVAQQVVFISPFTTDELLNEDAIVDETPSGFYGCQAASYLEGPNKINSINNGGYCSVKGNFFCAPSVTHLAEKDKYTTINSWSTEPLTKVGYKPVDLDFEEVEDHFEQLSLELKDEISILAKERNFSTKVLPARNFIPNAEFKTQNKKLPHWEIFAGSVVEQSEKGDVEKKLQQINLPVGKTLETERIAIPKDSNLKFSQSGTAPYEINLVDKDGASVLATGNTFLTNQASFLIIKFTGPGIVKEPLLQLVDFLGPTTYSYNPVEEIQRSGLACCPQDYCWNGYACIEPMNLFAEYTQVSEHIEDGRNYRCIAGEWRNSPIKWDWNAEKWGFCDDNKQCFVTKDGSLESEANFYDQTPPTTPPICVDNEDYVLDHYCEEGDWSSRTKFLATKLLEVAENNDNYVLYCTGYQDALLNLGDELRLGGETQLTVTKESPNPLTPATEEIVYTCFDALPDTLFKTEENTCVNNVCVLKFDNGAKRAFGTTLNKDVTNPDSFLHTLNIPQDQYETICAGTDDVIQCDLSNTNAEGELWYIPTLNAVIYSKEGIQLTPTILDTVVDWFKDLFGVDAELSGQNLFVQEAKNFNELYLLSKGDKKAKVIKEIFPKNKTIVAEYENFQTPVCDYVTAYNQNTLFGQEVLEIISGMKKLVCTVDNTTNIQSVEIAADDDALDFIWPQLTGKLRVEE